MLRKLLKFTLVPFAFLVVGVIRLLAKFGILIRFGELWSERIGHLAGNTECYLCERDHGLHPKSFDIWFHRRTPANKHFASMLRRVLWIDPTRFTRLIVICNMLFRGWEKHMAHSQQFDRDIYNLQEKYSPHLKFTLEEEMECEEKLREWGIPKGAKWVCLIVRDKAYLPTMHHHDYRDSDVETYVLAAKALAERGYYVFRMGAKVEKPFVVGHFNVIDYATNGMRSELMDIYLGANCEFCISNGTGFDAIPVIFRRPVVFVNYAPLDYLNTWINPSLAIWKHHYKDGKRMTLEEIYKTCGSFMAAQQFEQAGVTLQNNTPEEIRDVVLEMESVARFWRDGYELYRITEGQQKFWAGFQQSVSEYSGKPLHGQIRMRIGSKFLEQYS